MELKPLCGGVLPGSYMNRFREPFLSISHLMGAVFGLVGTLTLLLSIHSGLSEILILGLYGLTFIFLFSASALFHGLHHADESSEMFYEKLDYSSIYLFIAGTYTPLCFFALDADTGNTILLIQWTAALVGCLSIIRRGFAQRYLQVAIFLLMGWTFLLALNPLLQTLPEISLVYLFAGAAAYSFGAMIFAFAPPRICRGTLCTHSIWHSLVLVGATSHFMMISSLAPY